MDSTSHLSFNFQGIWNAVVFLIRAVFILDKTRKSFLKWWSAKPSSNIWRQKTNEVPVTAVLLLVTWGRLQKCHSNIKVPTKTESKSMLLAHLSKRFWLLLIFLFDCNPLIRLVTGSLWGLAASLMSARPQPTNLSVCAVVYFCIFI